MKVKVKNEELKVKRQGQAQVRRRVRQPPVLVPGRDGPVGIDLTLTARFVMIDPNPTDPQHGRRLSAGDQKDSRCCIRLECPTAGYSSDQPNEDKTPGLAGGEDDVEGKLPSGVRTRSRCAAAAQSTHSSLPDDQPPPRNLWPKQAGRDQIGKTDGVQMGSQGVTSGGAADSTPSHDGSDMLTEDSSERGERVCGRAWHSAILVTRSTQTDATDRQDLPSCHVTKPNIPKTVNSTEEQSQDLKDKLDLIGQESEEVMCVGGDILEDSRNGFHEVELRNFEAVEFSLFEPLETEESEPCSSKGGDSVQLSCSEDNDLISEMELDTNTETGSSVASHELMPQHDETLSKNPEDGVHVLHASSGGNVFTTVENIQEKSPSARHCAESESQQQQHRPRRRQNNLSLSSSQLDPCTEEIQSEGSSKKYQTRQQIRNLSSNQPVASSDKKVLHPSTVGKDSVPKPSTNSQTTMKQHLPKFQTVCNNKASTVGGLPVAPSLRPKGVDQKKKRGANGWEDCLRQRPKRTELFGIPSSEKAEQTTASSSSVATKGENMNNRGFPDRGKHLHLVKQKNGSPLAASIHSVRPAHPESVLGQAPDNGLAPGSLVWGRLRGSPMWPAVIIPGPLARQPPATHPNCWIFWFGDHKISLVSQSQTKPFVDSFSENYRKEERRKLFHVGVQEALQVCRQRSSQPQSAGLEDPEADLGWALAGFTEESCQQLGRGELPDFVVKCLNENMQKDRRERRVEPVRESDNHISAESSKLKEKKYEELRSGAIAIEEICIACGSPASGASQHPVFRGGLCAECKTLLIETAYAIGEDDTQVYCSICANGGELFLCGSPTCGRVYCKDCVKNLVGDEAVKQVEDKPDWLCFLCSPHTPQTHGLLKGKTQWQDNVRKMSTYNCLAATPRVTERRPIRVLSLFDRIGSGRLALERLGFEVEVYYSCELSQDAMAVTLFNYGDDGQRVTLLGDVRFLDARMVASLGRIDLLMCMPPQSKLHDWDDGEMTAKGLDEDEDGLVFRFMEIRSKLLVNNKHLFWVLEGEAPMRKQKKEDISLYLTTYPTLWDAVWFSAAQRESYFWTNIPISKSTQAWRNMDSTQGSRFHYMPLTHTEDTLKRHLKIQIEEKEDWPVEAWDILHLERAVGLPLHYTDACSFSPHHRRRLLDKARNFPILTHLLSSLQDLFCSVHGQQ